MKVEGEYIAINELYGSIDGHRTSIAKSLMYNNKQARHAVLGGVVVYDHWITTLEAFDFTATASGGNVKDLIDVSSYGTDFKNIKHDMDYTLEPSIIPANSSTSAITHEVKIRQINTGKELTVICTQAAAAITWTIEATLSVASASAKGGNVSTSVSWVRYKNGVRYDSGTTTPSSISGYANGSYGSYITGTSVYVPNAGTNTSQPIVFTITDYSFYVDGEKYDRSTTTYVKLGYNSYTTSTQYSVSVGSASPYTISANGGSFSVTATCKQRTKYTYSSGSTTYGEYSDASARVTYSNGVSSVSTSSFSGEKTITANVSENISGSRYPRITVTASNDSSEYDYASAYQEEVSYTLTAGSNQECNGDATNVNVSFVSSRNGKPYAPTITSGSSWASITSVTSSGSTYYAVVSVGANPNSSTRDVDITATQTRYNGNASKSLTITQAGKAVNLPKFKVEILELMYTDGVLSKVSYNIRLTAYPSSEYNGGTASNLRVALNTKKDGTGTNIVSPKLLASSVTVDRGATSDPYDGTLNSNGNFCYFLVYWDDKLQFASEIEENTDMPDI